MANDLIDDHVSVKQCRLAIDALHAYESKKQAKIEELELIGGKEPNIWLNVTVKKIPPGHRMKPVKVPIVHPLVDPRTTPICLITKDPQRQYKDLLEANSIKFISRVVGIEKLKGKFKPFEARRALLKENGMFLADERVIPLLPKLLGKKWFDAKKQPIPVCLTRKDLKGELERAISSTYMNQNQGTCTSVKIGVLSHKPAQIVANLQKALPTIAANIKDGWENIQALHIKTNSSVALPIWSCSLDATEEGRWHGLEAEDVEMEDAAAEEEAPKSKGKKKRASSEDDDEEEREEESKPKKRSKNADGSSAKKTAVKADSVSSTSKAAKAPASEKTASKEKAAKSSPAGKTGPTTGVESKPAAPPAKAKKGSKPAAEVASSPAKSAPKAKEPEALKAVSQAPKQEKKSKIAGSLEKKKEKIAKQKGSKSVKSALLGKKAGQE